MVQQHLESNPNHPKPSCDETVGNEMRDPNVNGDTMLYIPVGDIVKVSCGLNSNKRLVSYHLHDHFSSSGGLSSSSCYGDFLDLVCYKLSDHNAEWRVLSNPSNFQLPACVDECNKDR